MSDDVEKYRAIVGSLALRLANEVLGPTADGHAVIDLARSVVDEEYARAGLPPLPPDTTPAVPA